MSSGAGGPHRPRRPAPLPFAAMDSLGHSPDPSKASEVAHETAAVLVGTGRSTHDPALTSRLVGLVEELGLATLAELWAGRPARSLPGALWRLYALREWVARDAPGASADYAAGIRFADVPHVVAGVAEPPGPREVTALTDAILTGVFEGDLAVALERAAAFCRVVAAGRAARADEYDGIDPATATAQTRRASAMLSTGADLEICARLWRHGDLL